MNVARSLIVALVVGGLIAAGIILYSGQSEVEEVPGPAPAQSEPSETSTPDSEPAPDATDDPAEPKALGEEGEMIYGEALSEQDRDNARGIAVRFVSAFHREHESEESYESTVLPLLTEYQRNLIRTVDYRIIPPFEVSESKIHATGTNDALVDVVTSGGVVRVYVVRQGDQWLVQEYSLR